jgi:hypothetical protein
MLKLFYYLRTYDFLSSQDDIKINVVNKFRTLLKSRFKKIVKDIQEKHVIVANEQNRTLVDISDEILELSA